MPKTILLFGRNGQVARSLRDARGAYEIVALGRDNVDLTNHGAAKAAIAAHEAEIIINATAYTAVDKAESDIAAAQQLNHECVGEMAAAAKAADTPFIHISTDYVFDGRDTNHYTEDSPANPLNVYGQTKRDGEIAALAANPETIILRTSWVFSEYGANFVKTMLRLGAERNALNIVADQFGGPTAARDIARTLLTIAGKKERHAPGAGVYHYQGSPNISWSDFARKIFEFAKLEVKVTDILTADYKTAAARPLHTVLDCARIERDFGVAQPDWRISLRQVIAGLIDKENRE